MRNLGSFVHLKNAQDETRSLIEACRAQHHYVSGIDRGRGGKSYECTTCQIKWDQIPDPRSQ